MMRGQFEVELSVWPPQQHTSHVISTHNQPTGGIERELDDGVRVPVLMKGGSPLIIPETQHAG